MASSRDRLVAILRPVAEAIRPPADVRRAQRVERAITDDGRPRLDRATGALPAHALIATAAESARADPTDTSIGATVQDQLQDQSESIVDNAAALAVHEALIAAHGATGAVVGTTNTQTLSDKTLASPTFTGTVLINADGTQIFRIRNAAGTTSYFVADTTNGEIEFWNGTKSRWFSNAGTTETASVDAATGNAQFDGTLTAAGAGSLGSLVLGTDLAIADGGTGQGTAQAAINALSAVAAATNEHVLTKDTGTGNAVFKAATGGSYTDEQAQDAVGTILVDSATIDLTYADATPSITAAVINDSITYAKMQNVSATDRVLGRSTAGAGDVEEIILTAAGRALIDDADAAAQRTTLGLVAAGAGDIWVEKAGDTMTGALIVGAAISGNQRLNLGTISSLSGEIALREVGGGTITQILTGTGDPEGIVTADPGSVYLRPGGGAGATVYSKETGFGNTGWIALGAASGAPTTATYITQTAHGSLSAEQPLSALATGLLKVTTTTGVLSTAAFADIPVLAVADYKAQAASDTASSTDTTNYVDSISLAITLPVGTWTVTAISSTSLRHSAATTADARTMVNAVGGTAYNQVLQSGANNSRPMVTSQVQTGISGGGSVTCKGQYRPSDAGTATAINPWILVRAVRTA